MIWNDVITQLEPTMIMIYGNCQTNERDIDIVVVSNYFSKMFYHKRINKVKDYIDSEVKIDPICLTEDEYKHVCKNPSSFMAEVIRTGVVVYERADRIHYIKMY